MSDGTDTQEPVRRGLASGLAVRFQHQARYALEDGVVGDQRHAEPESGRRDPPIAVMDLLSQRMTGSLAVRPELGVHDHKFCTRVHNLGRGKTSLHPESSRIAPTAVERSEADLCSGLERDERRTTSGEWPIPLGQS